MDELLAEELIYDGVELISAGLKCKLTGEYFTMMDLFSICSTVDAALVCLRCIFPWVMNRISSILTVIAL